MRIFSLFGFNKFWKKFVFVVFLLHWKMEDRLDGLQHLTIIIEDDLAEFSLCKNKII